METGEEQVEFAFSGEPARRGQDTAWRGAALLSHTGSPSLKVTLAVHTFNQDELRQAVRALDIDVLVIPPTERASRELREGMQQWQGAAETAAGDILSRMLNVLIREGFSLAAALRPEGGVSRAHLQELLALRAHLQRRRDAFVTADPLLLLGRMGLKRRALEAEFGTRILSRDEFLHFCTLSRTSRAKPPPAGEHWSVGVAGKAKGLRARLDRGESQEAGNAEA